MDRNRCAACGESSRYRQIYDGVIRAGRFGSLTSEPRTIVECETCGARRLLAAPSEAVQYEDDEYRRKYDGAADARTYMALHDGDQNSKLARVGIERLRDRVVADFGCGGGSFLDCARGVAKRTIAVEPSRTYKGRLRESGHDVYSDGSELPPSSVDLAVTFQVIEHVPDPQGFLRGIHASLKPGGSLFLTTPNRDDVLMQLGAQGYEQFFYRTAHLWYFDSRSLERVARAAGFAEVAVRCEHRYDLSNALCWLRDSRPTGLGHVSFLDGRLDDAWRGFLEANFLGDTLWLSARRV